MTSILTSLILLGMSKLKLFPIAVQLVLSLDEMEKMFDEDSEK